MFASFRVAVGNSTRLAKPMFNRGLAILSGDSINRNAVPASSPGLALRLPWETEMEIFNRNVVVAVAI
jgi:hypothetical protein